MPLWNSKELCGLKQYIEHRIKKHDSKMELVPLKTVWGEAKAWETLEGLMPKAVCSGAKALYDGSDRAYTIKAFGIDFTISLDSRTISSGHPGAGLFLERYKDFFKLAILWYMTSAYQGQVLRLDNCSADSMESGTIWN